MSNTMIGSGVKTSASVAINIRGEAKNNKGKNRFRFILFVSDLNFILLSLNCVCVGGGGINLLE